MSFSAQDRRWARVALAELDADEPDRTPVQLIGGQAAWGTDPVARVEAARDPANAPAMRPHVIAACQQLAAHRPVRLRCTCGRHLEFLAIAAFATGVLVVSSPRLVPQSAGRRGGLADLAPLDDQDPDARWSLLAWEELMRARDAATVRTTSWQVPSEHPVLGVGASVIGDTAKRTTFTCGHCGATLPFLNVTLLRRVLQSIAAGENEVRLSAAPS